MAHKEVFVFGSNLAGRHGKGSALEALNNHGAVYGKGHGRYGDSYAIPTKDIVLQTLKIKEIAYFVKKFIDYAKEHPTIKFNVVEIGCGLAGYTPQQIAPLFRKAPTNVRLPESFKQVLGLSSPLREYAEMVIKEGGTTRKQAEYCLALVDEFKPDLEEFLNQVIDKALEMNGA